MRGGEKGDQETSQGLGTEGGVGVPRLTKQQVGDGGEGREQGRESCRAGSRVVSCSAEPESVV